jgi:DNA-binding transcriptional ArsR family regulator
MQSDDTLLQIEEHFHVLPLGEKSQDLGKILSTETSVKILENVYTSGGDVGISASKISELMGVGRTTVLYHLGRMLESGLLQINPILANEDSWNKFWDLYRSGNTKMSVEEFNQVHTARMNGVKLYMPTKKGFLVLPSIELIEGKSMVNEVLTSLTSLAVDRDYRRLKKTSSLLGTLGALLIALSFVFQMPYFQADQAFQPYSSDLSGEEMLLQEKLNLEGASSPPPDVVKQTPDRSSSTALAPAVGLSSESEDLADGVDSVAPLEPESVAAHDLPVQTKEEEGRQQVQLRALWEENQNPAPTIFLFAGTLFIGAFVGFLIYSRSRQK